MLFCVMVSCPDDIMYFWFHVFFVKYIFFYYIYIHIEVISIVATRTYTLINPYFLKHRSHKYLQHNNLRFSKMWPIMDSMTYDSKIHTYDLHRYTLKNLSFLSLFCPSTGEGRRIRLSEVSTVRWNWKALNDHIENGMYPKLRWRVAAHVLVNPIAF